MIVNVCEIYINIEIIRCFIEIIEAMSFTKDPGNQVKIDAVVRLYGVQEYCRVYSSQWEAGSSDRGCCARYIGPSTEGEGVKVIVREFYGDYYIIVITLNLHRP